MALNGPHEGAPPAPTGSWTVLVVDDEAEVREITHIVLGDLEFEGRRLEIIDAGSSREARAILAARPDIALMLVDVVMETEHAGLELVRHVRDELKNRLVRIVLRTGHPGQAPERDVIRSFDINDYKEKTELTSRKLETMVYVALRGFRDLMMIDAARDGLERVVESSAQIQLRHKSHEFASAVLTQLAALVGLQRGALYCTIPRGREVSTPRIEVAAATGEFEPKVRRSVEESLPPIELASVREALSRKKHVFANDHYVLYFTDRRDSESLLIVAEAPRLSELDMHLVKVFCTNVSIAFENLHLNQELIDSQLEMLCLLAGAAETRSRETANHVKRVGLLAEIIAVEYGLDERATEAIRFAAPLHDIGKIAIPDAVLNKPGAHSAEEAVVMRTHAERGAQLLSQSKSPLIRLAAEIAWTHHENWDGSGYPRRLSGEGIPIGGRIAALADVYDALGSRRCYKEAWAAGAIRDLLIKERGRKFEPKLVDILLMRWAEAEAIRRDYPD